MSSDSQVTFRYATTTFSFFFISGNTLYCGFVFLSFFVKMIKVYDIPTVSTIVSDDNRIHFSRVFHPLPRALQKPVRHLYCLNHRSTFHYPDAWSSLPLFKSFVMNFQASLLSQISHYYKITEQHKVCFMISFNVKLL